MRTRHQWLFRKQLSLVSLIKLLLDPIVAIGMLAASASWYGEVFDNQYWVLSLIVFSLTFPGSWPDARLKWFWQDIVVPWLVIASILFFFGYASGYLGVFPSEVIVAWLVATPFALYLAHRGVRAMLPKILAWEGSNRTAVIVGATDIGRRLGTQLCSEHFLGISFNGYFDDRDRTRLGELPQQQLVGRLDDLVEHVKRNGVDLVYIALPMASQPRIMKLLDGLRDTTASVYFTPDIFTFDLIQARVDEVAVIPVVAVCETPFDGVSGIFKRLSDLALASVILVLIAPLMVALAIGVKFSSPGPILFRQRRYGLDGEEIIVYKFRSMTVSEDGAVVTQAKKNDKRVTPLGAIMRRTSLDELPQFINVLQGRMSIVGPRPHAVAHNEQYRKLIKGYMMRHKVKPGITGWAQVNGLRGETETLDKMQARVEYDIDYLRNWSLMFDLMIVLKTVLVVLRDRNAY